MTSVTETANAVNPQNVDQIRLSDWLASALRQHLASLRASDLRVLNVLWLTFQDGRHEVTSWWLMEATGLSDTRLLEAVTRLIRLGLITRRRLPLVRNTSPRYRYDPVIEVSHAE